MWLNQHEIEWIAMQRHTCPNVRKGVQLLLRLMEATNAQSDGWCYWPKPAKAAEKLTKLLHTAGYLPNGTTGTITEADLRKAVAPIRSMVTQQKKLQAARGNSFDFDVDAALASAGQTTSTTGDR